MSRWLVRVRFRVMRVITKVSLVIRDMLNKFHIQYAAIVFEIRVCQSPSIRDLEDARRSLSYRL